MLNEYRISALIPVRNGEAVLQQCLTSVLNQDMPVFECIIVDNNSTDRTTEMVRQAQKAHPNLVCVFES